MVNTAKADAIASATSLANTAKNEAITQAAQLASSSKAEAIAEAANLANNATSEVISTSTSLTNAAKADAKLYTDAKFAEISNSANAIKSDTNGNIGIGTDLNSNPNNFKLAVNGIIGAKEINVTQTGWADFVFAPDYNLKPLAEVEQYIKTYGSLPEIPKTSEVEQNGLNLGDMQSKLLQKVEELTLYSIDLEKKNGELQREMKELKEFVMQKLR